MIKNPRYYYRGFSFQYILRNVSCDNQLLHVTCNIENPYEGDFFCEIGSVMLTSEACRHIASPVKAYLAPLPLQFFFQWIQDKPIDPFPDVWWKFDWLQVAIFIPVAEVIGPDFVIQNENRFG